MPKLTELNRIYCGNALDLIKELEPLPNLIIMSPPDKNETDYSLPDYVSFLDEIYTRSFEKLQDGGVLVSITTDTKINGAIFLKHAAIIESILANQNAKLFNYKIWAKSLKTNLYILNFCHMLFFQKGKKITTKDLIPEFYPDVWLLESDKLKDYPSKDSFPSELIQRLIRCFTREGDLVLDPFIGSGKTGKVAREYQRNFIGFELNPDFVTLANKYIGVSQPITSRAS